MKYKLKKINFKDFKSKKYLIIILVIIVILIVLYNISNNIFIDNNKKSNLVINNKNVTVNLKKDILIEDNEIYLSKQDLGNFFDKYIYEDKNNNQIITTYNSKIATISLEKNEMEINGAYKDTFTHAIKKDDTIYIPISEMKDVYGIDINYNKDSKVLVIDSVEKEQKKAIVVKDTVVKSSTHLISKTMDRVKKSDYIVVVSEEKGYTKVRTERGKVGYIKTNKIANTVVTREEIKEEKKFDGKVNLVWDYYSNYAKAPDRSNEKMDGVNVVAPSFFYLDSEGKLKENIGQKGTQYIKWAHDNGYKVWPIVQNAGDNMMDVTSTIINDYNKRKNLIENLLKLCYRYNLDGINIDFENMKQEDKDMFSRFIIEIEPRFNEMGLDVSVDVTAPDGSETWSLCFDRNVIGDVADYIVFMAYDEYGQSSSKPGTTAGYNWVELSLKKFLETEEIDSDKIILAIPLYTRVWTVDNSEKLITQKTVSMKNIDNILPEGTKKKWDDDLKQYYAEFQDGQYVKKIWIEDYKSLKEKINLISNYNLAGVASWQKDFEPEDFWKFLKNELTN